MGFLDNTSITVDAILTKTGRRKLSQGTFQVTKFSLSDEEIDYTLYDTTHPNGTDAYGTVIENMNVLEAFPNRDSFQSHLTDASTSGAKIQLSPLNYTGIEAGDEIPIGPNTIGGPGGEENYSFIAANSNIVALIDPAGGLVKSVANAPSVIAVAQEFVTPQPDGTTNITVTGLESGLVAVVSITVKYTPTSSDDGNNPVQKDSKKGIVTMGTTKGKSTQSGTQFQTNFSKGKA